MIIASSGQWLLQLPWKLKALLNLDFDKRHDLQKLLFLSQGTSKETQKPKKKAATVVSSACSFPPVCADIFTAVKSELPIPPTAVFSSLVLLGC